LVIETSLHYDARSEKHQIMKCMSGILYNIHLKHLSIQEEFSKALSWTYLRLHVKSPILICTTWLYPYPCDWIPNGISKTNKITITFDQF